MERYERPAQKRGKRQKAVRLTFSYEGDSIKLIKQQSLSMIPPPPDELKPQKEASGFWVEVKDGEKNVIYRRTTQNPIRHYVEVRSDDLDRPLSMQEVKDPSGIFTLLIPQVAGAKEVVLYSSPFSPEKRLKPAVEIARFDLKGGRKRKET